jgi:hypothetical protein
MLRELFIIRIVSEDRWVGWKLTFRKPLILLTTIVLLVISGCSNNNTMPDEMPNNFDFLVQFGVGSKNEINTFTNTLTKDLIEDGTIETSLTFTPDEMKEIYQKMSEIYITAPKTLIPPKTDCRLAPHNEDYWEIVINGERLELGWTNKYCKTTNDAKQLLEVRNYIFDIVKNKDEYKELPEAKGGYK